MDIKEAAEAIKDHAESGVKRLASIIGSLVDDVQRNETKTDDALRHLIAIKRTAFCVLAIVLADFIAGLWLGVKLF